MIVQACLNGGHARDFHPRVPIQPDDIAREGESSIAASAAELHIHARGPNGKESLASVDETILAVRRTCPGTLIGVSTGAWIESDEIQTRDCIARWRELPDYASVNLAEHDVPAVMELLRQRGVGIEAGLSSVADAERFLKFPGHGQVLRVLLEIEEKELDLARQVADDIAGVLNRAGIRRPILLHGFRATVWPFVGIAHQRRWSTRVGLEDGKHLKDGTIAADNAALVANATAIFRGISAH